MRIQIAVAQSGYVLMVAVEKFLENRCGKCPIGPDNDGCAECDVQSLRLAVEPYKVAVNNANTIYDQVLDLIENPRPATPALRALVQGKCTVCLGSGKARKLICTECNRVFHTWVDDTNETIYCDKCRDEGRGDAVPLENRGIRPCPKCHG